MRPAASTGDRLLPDGLGGTIRELLILVQAPLIVALFATLHRFAPPSGRSLI